MMSEKEIRARDLADRLTDQDDTDVTVEKIRQWRSDEVYEWLELGWGFTWSASDQEWVKE